MHPKNVLAKKLFYQLKICPSPKKNRFFGQNFFWVHFLHGYGNGKWKQPLNILENGFYKQVLEFHRPSKFLCQTSGRQNHWSLPVIPILPDLFLYENLVLVGSEICVFVQVVREACITVAFLSQQLKHKVCITFSFV